MFKEILAFLGICPTCNCCGAKMKEFDGVSWYTCPKCGNSVRIVGQDVKWKDELYKQGTKEVKSNRQRYNICRGEDDDE